MKLISYFLGIAGAFSSLLGHFALHSRFNLKPYNAVGQFDFQLSILERLI